MNVYFWIGRVDISILRNRKKKEEEEECKQNPSWGLYRRFANSIRKVCKLCNWKIIQVV